MLWIILGVILGAILVTLIILWLSGERWRLIRPSTWQVMRENGLKGILNFNAIHGYIYGRWTKQYLGIIRNVIYPYFGERGKKWLRDHYHAKILTPEQAAAIITIEQDIPLQDLEQVIPYPAARNIILNGPPDIVVYECACRQLSSNHCQPTQVCMVIGKPFTDYTLEHHPQSSRRLSQEEAIKLLQDEHERGHLHSAWFKDACLDRFYAICNCCKCCCGGIEAMVKYGNPVMASSGYVAQVDKSICTGCGICVDACPFNALSIEDETSVMDWEKCLGCGICEAVCPNDARSLVRDEGKGIPLDVRLLIADKTSG
jgi:ferredoxin